MSDTPLWIRIGNRVPRVATLAIGLLALFGLSLIRLVLVVIPRDRWQHAALSAVLQSGGIVCGLFLPHDFAPAGWFTGVVLVPFEGWAASRGAVKA